MKVVLFLGAGFSKPFDLPVMNDFLSAADSSKRVTDEDRAFLGQLLLDARRANSFLQSSPFNLEDILSFAVMSDRLALDDERKAPSVKRVLQRVYSHPSNVPEYWKRYDQLQDFLGFHPRDDRETTLTVITTNYDLNAECALVRMGLPADPGFEFVQADGGSVVVQGELYSSTGTSVLKLHGSINFFADEDERKLQVEGRIVAVGGPVPSEQSSLPYACAGDWTGPAEPVIVPPSFLKPELPVALNRVWARAAKALREANIVVFVGYSFPASDTEMMYFLATGLAENTRLRRIVLVDPKAHETIGKLDGPGSRLGSHFRDLLEPIPDGWLETRLRLGSSG